MVTTDDTAQSPAPLVADPFHGDKQILNVDVQTGTIRVYCPEHPGGPALGGWPAKCKDPTIDPTCDCNGIDIKAECPSLEGFDWEVYAEELYRARAMLFSEGLEVSKAMVLSLLHRITKKFSFAFECPLATMSTYWTLAQMMAMEGNKRRALAYLHMGFIFVRDRGFHECTPWPVQGWDVMLSGQKGVAEVQKLDGMSIRFDVPAGFRFDTGNCATVFCKNCETTIRIRGAVRFQSVSIDCLDAGSRAHQSGPARDVNSPIVVHTSLPHSCTSYRGRAPARCFPIS